MLWAALRLPLGADASPPSPDALRGVAIWALQFTPRVAVLDESVVAEVEASVRLFGGKRALRDRIFSESKELGVIALAWATNSLASLALARHGIENGFKKPLDQLLDGLPFEVLTAAVPHQPTLARLGCTTLGDVRRLPRGGMARRFDKHLLAALDQAYGMRPEVHEWITVPETFYSRLELMSRVELAPALLFGARRLLLQLCGWLAARHAGTTNFTLRWAHDSMRAKHVEGYGQLMIRTAQPMRDLEHLCRLLAENLAKVKLEAPVGELELRVDEVEPMEEISASLLPDTVQEGEALGLVLERLAARFGPERVLRPVACEDHRLEWMTHWQPAAEPQPRKAARLVDTPQPTWCYAQPLKLHTRGDMPFYQGPLLLLTGPHRIEGGWWDRIKEDDEEETRNVQRDYWLAVSEHAGVLWIYQERLGGNDAAWFLQGVFA